jgi:hypothetical protein
VFPATRVRRIVLAQDALTHAEESVYDVLWGQKNMNRDSHRFASLSYEAISKAARVTKTNAKGIVERLIYKGFLQVEVPADMLHRIPTKYRVFSYRTALDNMTAADHLYVVKTGNGVIFVHPLGIVLAGPKSTVIADPTSTVPAGQSTTMAPGQSSTVPDGQSSTVPAASTLLDTCSEATLLKVISTASGQIIGNDAAMTIVFRCRAQAPDVTDEELADITKTVTEQAMREKRSNLTGWLLTVLPGHFAGESFRIYRETQIQLREQQHQRREAEEQSWRQILEDPGESEEMKKLAREVLGIEPAMAG